MRICPLPIERLGLRLASQRGVVLDRVKERSRLVALVFEEGR